MARPHWTVTEKTKSRIETVISIAFLLAMVVFAKAIDWVYGEDIKAHYGHNTGAFELNVVVPIVILLALIVDFVGAYFIISFLYGKVVAKEILYRWKKLKK